jgi:hypothetical protein
MSLFNQKLHDSVKINRLQTLKRLNHAENRTAKMIVMNVFGNARNYIIK